MVVFPSPVVVAAVSNGTLARGAPIGLRIDSVGLLAVPTGRLITAEPIVFDRDPPLARAAPVGRFPVRVLLVPAPYPGTPDLVAAQWIEFEPAVPEGWEPAARFDGGTAPAIADRGHRGCLLDEACADEYELQRAVSMERTLELVRQATSPRYEWPRHYALVQLGGGHNMLVFEHYAWAGRQGSYWGLRGGRAVCLIAEFGGLGA